MDIKVSPEFLMVLMVLAGVASIQFFKGRKLNLMLMQHYLKAIEDIIKPKDKEYVWLGGYIGFRAHYKVSEGNIDKFEYTLTLLPRQSIFYMPISKLISRHDKLYIVVRPYSQIKRETHLIQKRYYRIRPKIEDEELLQKDFIEIEGKEYETLFEKRRDVELLREFLQGFSKPENVKHVSLTPKTNVFYILMKPEPETIQDDIRHIVRFVNEKLKESPFER
ncbi:hypothetical protein [Thermococcus sp.]